MGKRQYHLFEDSTDSAFMGTGKSLKVEENAEAAGRSQVMRKLLAGAGITGLHTKCNRRSFQVRFLFCFVCLMGWHSQLCISKSPSDSIITETGQKSSRGAGTGKGMQGKQQLKSTPRWNAGAAFGEPRS